MINKAICCGAFVNYLNDCGLDASYWNCVEASEMMMCWLAAHDFVMSRRFADWPIGVRTQIVSSTLLRPFEKCE
nr:MAG TPA: hypothetical protein [Caudoviricetes sp.]